MLRPDLCAEPLSRTRTTSRPVRRARWPKHGEAGATSWARKMEQPLTRRMVAAQQVARDVALPELPRAAALEAPRPLAAPPPTGRHGSGRGRRVHRGHHGRHAALAHPEVQEAREVVAHAPQSEVREAPLGLDDGRLHRPRQPRARPRPRRPTPARRLQPPRSVLLVETPPAVQRVRPQAHGAAEVRHRHPGARARLEQRPLLLRGVPPLPALAVSRGAGTPRRPRRRVRARERFISMLIPYTQIGFEEGDEK